MYFHIHSAFCAPSAPNLPSLATLFNKLVSRFQEPVVFATPRDGQAAPWRFCPSAGAFDSAIDKLHKLNNQTA
jgi:hypothetical protein